MDDGLLDDLAVSQMLDNYPLEEARSHLSIPYSFRVHDHDRPAAAHAKAWGLAALHAGGAEEQTFALQQRRKQRVECAAAAIGGAEAASAHQHVSRVWLHGPGLREGCRKIRVMRRDAA